MVEGTTGNGIGYEIDVTCGGFGSNDMGKIDFPPDNAKSKSSKDNNQYIVIGLRGKGVRKTPEHRRLAKADEGKQSNVEDSGLKGRTKKQTNSNEDRVQ